MPKYLREKLKNQLQVSASLSDNHRVRFQERLEKEVKRKVQKRPKRVLKIAASIILLLSIGWRFMEVSSHKTTSIPLEEISLGSLSPELKSIESYYVNTINYEIIQLNLNDENKELMRGYLSKISELTTDYKSLTTELSTKGVQDAIINALIDNLQLRLQLLQRLKKQVKELQQLNRQQDDIQHI